jgi:cobalt-zinc-cadmium efflux system protein
VGLTGRPAASGDRRWLTLALILVTCFMAAEVIVAVVAHSLALLSDAATCSPTRR